MNKNCWILLGALLSTRLLAQQVTNAPLAAPIETPPPAPAVTAPSSVAPVEAPTEAKTNAPAKAATKKKAPSKKKSEKKPVAKVKDTAAELKSTPLVPGPAVVDARHVNLRGQPRLAGEVLTRLEKGTPVTVVEEITHNNSGPDEPSAWAKILLPTNAPVWVSSAYINPTNKTVIPKKLNMRGGPGENYSVIGRLQQGETVTEITSKGDWTQIETPTNAFGFVAAQYLKQEAPGAIAAPAAIASAAPAAATTNAAPAEPAPAATTVTEAPTIASTTTETPPAASTNAAPASSTNAAPTETAAAAAASTNAAPAAPVASAEPAAPAAPAAEEPPAKRIVEHEGLVRGSTSIQAPSHFALISTENGRIINYLYTTSTNLDLRRYKGMRIVVTGEEGLDERWPNTPIIKIQKIQVVE